MLTVDLNNYLRAVMNWCPSSGMNQDFVGAIAEVIEEDIWERVATGISRSQHRGGNVARAWIDDLRRFLDGREVSIVCILYTSRLGFVGYEGALDEQDGQGVE